MSNLPPPVIDTTPRSSYTCPYCRLDGDATGTSCTHCGAPVDIRAATSESGWEKQPAIRDMARIQFGHSTCQVSGSYVPAAEMRLAPGESIYFGHHQLLWADEKVTLGNQPLKGAWNRKMAGLDVVMMNATGPGTVALAENHPGETIAVPLMPGRSVDVREHRFITATQNVTYDWYQSGIWYSTTNGDETETHYPAGIYLDRFASTDTPGLLLLHGRGNVFVRDLAPGQTICVHPGAFVWKDSSVSMMMHLERPSSGGGWFMRWQPATPWIRIMGPGRVAVSSAYERMESTGRISNTSQCTTVDWNYQRPSQQIASVQSAMANAFNDAPFEAALDAFATAQGFTIGADKNRGVSHAHEYSHPAGINISCSVVDASAATAVLGNIAGVLGSQGGALANRLTAKLGQMGGGASANDGQPIDGLGSPAHWKQTSATSSVLTVNKNNRVLNVTISANMAANDQLGWLQAFAAAGLPTV